MLKPGDRVDVLKATTNPKTAKVERAGVIKRIDLDEGQPFHLARVAVHVFTERHGLLVMNVTGDRVVSRHTFAQVDREVSKLEASC